MRFISIATNSYIFIRFDNLDKIVIINLYINNILIITKTEAIIKTIKKKIYKTFKYTKTESINRILSI